MGFPDLLHHAADAFLAGRDEACEALLTRGFQERTDAGDVVGAVRCAFWLVFSLHHQDAHARAAGWFGRAQRLLDALPADGAEAGYFLVPVGLQRMGAGDLEGARAAFHAAASAGERHRDPDLACLARHVEGRVRIRQGDLDDGIALLDEVMVSVTGGELTPIVAGTVYCGVLAACLEVFDMRRASEWTSAFSRWCAERSDLVAYRGQCRVRRSELLRFHGEWPAALAEAEAAEAGLRTRARSDRGAACYQVAEIHRLRGAFDEAETAYRRAADCGRRPEPGMPLLELARGHVAAAWAAIARARDEATSGHARTGLLPAFIEIALAAGAVPEARAATAELDRAARDIGSRYLAAEAETAAGAVLLAERHPDQALPPLRRAQAGWEAMEARREVARVRARIGMACRALGDHRTADFELEWARRTLTSLGAEPDLAVLAHRDAPPAPDAGLTGREREVLVLVATGETNRGIAASLGISEKTVARHVSNIFLKVGVSTRAAATAWAYEHRIVKGPPA